MSPLTQTSGISQWRDGAADAAEAQRAVVTVNAGGDYEITADPTAAERARFLDRTGTQAYELLEISGVDGLAPGVIVAEGPDLRLTTRALAAGAAEAAILVAEGPDLRISTDLARPRAADLFLDGRGNLAVCPRTADRLDLVAVGGTILAY